MRHVVRHAFVLTALVLTSALVGFAAFVAAAPVTPGAGWM